VTYSRRTRLTVCASLFLYCAAIVVFALTPVVEIDWAEIVTAAIAFLAGIGLIAHAFDAIKLPGEDYAYLIVGWAGFTATLIYLIDTHDGEGRRAALTMLLLVGVFGGYGAHLGLLDEGYGDGQ
jgi:hypothetical protein